MSPQELITRFRLVECPDFGPRYNITPLQSVPIIRQRPTGERVAQLLRWGCETAQIFTNQSFVNSAQVSI